MKSPSNQAMKLYSDLSSAQRFLHLMEDLDFEQRISTGVLDGVLELRELTLSHESLLNRAKAFFREKAVFIPEGLEQLPSSWLASLPEVLWQTRKPHWKMIPYFIGALSKEEGVLRMEFKQEAMIGKEGLSRFDEIRVRVNLGIGPNLWQGLSRAEERQLWEYLPELRTELLRVA